MDKHQQLERQILDAALAKAAQIGVLFDVIEHPGAHDTGLDATLLLRTQPDQLRYGVEIKQHLRPGALGPILQKLRSLTTRPLLIATDITPPIAETLRAQGVEFLDTAGNAFLKEPPFLHVFVKGQKGALPSSSSGDSQQTWTTFFDVSLPTAKHASAAAKPLARI